MANPTHSDDEAYKLTTLEAVEDARDNLGMALAIHGLDSREPVLLPDTLTALQARAGRWYGWPSTWPISPPTNAHCSTR